MKRDSSQRRSSCRFGMMMAAALFAVAGLGRAGEAAADPPSDDEETAGIETVFGDSTSILGSHARTYIQLDPQGKPRAMGLEFTRSMLADLPFDPPFDGNNCFDINGDGDLSFHDPMECAGGYQAILFFPQKVVKEANLPFEWFLLNWNPVGHLPFDVYDVPHFDFHFYILDYVSRNFIRVGSCGIVVDCQDFETAIKPLPPQFLAPDYQDFQAVEPRMGNHLVDITSPELTGGVFTRTFVYGAYDGKIAYYEPMITLEHLQTQPNKCLPIKQPSAFEVAGYYPTTYCIHYNENKKKYRVSIEGFVFRDAF